MAFVKLFSTRPEEINTEEPRVLSWLETEIGIFTLPPRVKEIIQVNGPYATILPPLEKGKPERVMYTASVVYK